MTETEHRHDETTQMWKGILENGHRDYPSSFLPGNPRCRMCLIPIGGVGGILMKSLRGRIPSRKNPNVCNYWDDVLPVGGAEIEISVMFADVRGSTALAERIGPTEFATLMNRFYRVATDVLVPRSAILDKMIGDEVMAFYLPAFVKDSRPTAVASAVALLDKFGYGKKDGPWLEVGIGINYGTAFVGKVGTGDVNDFTALGDAVNTAARLQADAASGQIVMSESVHNSVSADYPDAQSIEIDAKGKAELVSARVVTIG